jgi:hypothetical protein
MSEAKRVDCTSIVERLFEKYKDDEYMLQRIYNHIYLHLPNTLENEARNHEKRQNLNSYLSEEQQIFMQVFLSKNNYYYLPNNGFFYEYNGKDYFIVKEDEIIHKLLSTISKERVLLQWKYKTKINIIKQIKDRHLFTSIPETDTIQSVLNVLYPSIFTSKSAAKYFLTIVGDNLLRKNSNLIFLVSPKMKQLLHELEGVAVLSVGSENASSKFITKYHENHSFENIRLLHINENVSNDYWRELLKRIGLNLLCIATHYSKRYQHSDHFLNNCSDDDLLHYVHTLKNTTQQEIVQRFVDECIESTTEPEYCIEWKNVHFMWKQFLSGVGLPNVVFSTTLKSTLSEMFVYDKETDSFKGITSKYLPVYKDFIKFWETTMVTTGPNQVFENELEIDEIHSLFKASNKNRSTLSEETIIKIIKHFFPSFEIVEDKYVLNVTSTMWDKVEDIRNSFPFIKEQIKTEHTTSLISFDEVYTFYQKYVMLNLVQFVVSKRFFEKYLYYQCTEYVFYEKFIRIDWIEG